MTRIFPVPSADTASPVPARPKKKLAIVSTFDDLCGIAGYTRFLIKQLEHDFDVEVFDLDQFFMRATDRRVRKLADKMVRDFCRRARSYDFVNVQLEHGTLGHNATDIIRRFRWIAQAAPALSVTFHTSLLREPLDSRAILRDLAALRISKALSALSHHRRVKRMDSSFSSLLRKLSWRKPVNVIVHTRRDMRVMRYVNRLKSVYDHPLSFLAPAEASALRATTRRADIAGLAPLPDQARLIGVFGFLSEYKGFDTVIRALHILPEDHHLLIFGAVHPNEIKKGETVYPYLRKLLDETYVDRSLFDGLGNATVSVAAQAERNGLFVSHPRNIGARVHFLGAQSDEGFARAMAVCDHVVLPYLEVGQSASGPMSIAVEMGCRVIAARNHAFLQFARYHPDAIEFFDIGNHLELAERILAKPAYPAAARALKYTVATNRKTYLAANSRPSALWSAAAAA